MVDTLPENERQIRPLTKLAPEQQLQVWGEVIEQSAGKRITERVVSDVVDALLSTNALKQEKTPTLSQRIRRIRDVLTPLEIRKFEAALEQLLCRYEKRKSHD